MVGSQVVSGAFPAFPMTKHAAERISSRRLAPGAAAALLFGRVVRTRGAEIFVIGRKEVTRYALEGIDLSRHEGVQVVCGPGGGPVLTAYRNRELRRLRPRRRHGRHGAA
jgi:hypothetical protein